MTPSPPRPLVWLLGRVSSRDAANAAIGDVIEELDERIAADRKPRLPTLWVSLGILRAIGLEIIDAGPRLARSTGLILRDAARAIRAAPAHALFVVVVLAAGIALGTVTFSVVDAVILTPLPLERPDQLVFIPTRDSDFKERITPRLYWRLREELTSVEDLSAQWTLSGTMVSVDDVTDQNSITHASADIFRILRLSPAIGRLWTAADESRGETDVAVLGYRFWQEQFGGDPSVLGRTVSEGTHRYTVIGVLSGESDHPEVSLTTAAVWVPMVVPRTASGDAFGIIARMRPGATPAQVAADVQRIAGAPDWQPNVIRILDSYVSNIRRWMLLALGAAVLVILVASANAANMMLTRSVARTHEMAIRASLGVSRRWIALVVLGEGLMLSFAATAVALLFSFAGVDVAKAALASALPGLFRASTIALDGRVWTVAIGCAVATGVLFSLVPAWQTSRVPVSTLLKDSEAPTATGRRRWRSAFLTAEIATVVVLLVVSWLFVFSLVRAVGIDLGIERTNLLAVSPRIEFRATVDEVRQRVERVPGVQDVAVSSGGASLPLIGRAFGGAWPTTTLERVDPNAGAGEESAITAMRYRVTLNYFTVAGLDFRRGGTWSADVDAEPPAVVLDVEAARRLFGEENPIGREVRSTRPAGIFIVVGTVPHVYARGPEDPDPPLAYFAIEPDPSRTYAGLFVKTSRPPEELVPVVTAALDGMGPDLEEPFVFAADDAVSRITAMRRFLAKLMSIFGLVGTMIAAAGVYAVMASFVAQQRREIGVRMALGATPGRVQRSVLGLAWRHLLAGLVLGVPLAWWLSRGFASLLFQVTPADVSVYTGVAALVCAVGCLAAWFPARRAARVDPIRSLRR